MSRFFVYGTLPSLEFNIKPEISSRVLADLFELNLGKITMHKIRVMKLWIDIINIYEILNEGNFDRRGNYSKSTIKSLIANEEELPQYLFDFFHEYKEEEARKEHFSKVMADYFRQEKKEAHGLLKEFLSFEHAIRILLAGFRAKKGGGDLSKELQYEDVDDPIVAAVLMQKDRGGKFQFPMDYEDLEKVLDDAGNDPSEQYKGIARYRFEFYMKYFTNSFFSLEGIVAYMLALWILEDFFSLKRDEGEKELRNIVEREHGT